MRKTRPIIILMTAVLLLTACNFPKPTTTPSAVGQDTVQTVAAKTVEALLTQSAPNQRVPPLTLQRTPQRRPTHPWSQNLLLLRPQPPHHPQHPLELLFVIKPLLSARLCRMTLKYHPRGNS